MRFDTWLFNKRFNSVIQGSAIGPASYIVTETYLRPIHKVNQIFKFADDIYFVVPVSQKYVSPGRICPAEK